MNVVLIGFMGTGKSAIGQELARYLDVFFVDADAEIEAAAGKSIARIFAEDGEAVFRIQETALLERLASELSFPKSAVIATGGGMPLRPENVALLRRIGRVVWLTAPAEQILRRVGPDFSVRPLLAAYQDDPLARIEGLLAARELHYASAADLLWDTSRHPSPEEAAAALAKYLCQPDAPLQPALIETP